TSIRPFNRVDPLSKRTRFLLSPSPTRGEGEVIMSGCLEQEVERMASQKSIANEEKRRLEEDRLGRQPWRRWGPYLSERQWGTVREDYSPNGTVRGLQPERNRMGILSARPCPEPGVSVGRGRHRRCKR